MNKDLFITASGRNFSSELIPVFFLHGFSGSANDWEDLMRQIPEPFFPIAINLPGHGQNILSFKESNYSPAGIITQIMDVYNIFKIGKAVLVGYSMGGRAALTFAVNKPHLVSGLFLESSTAGLYTTSEKDNRIIADEKLAGFILNHTIEEFLDYWMNLPLFKSQNKLAPEIIRKLKEAKLNCSKEGMAASLRGFGTGKMPWLWNEIKNIKSPVQLLTGELDEKFTKINEDMNQIFLNSRHTIVKNCGHNIHLENPDEFLRVLLLFLNQF